MITYEWTVLLSWGLLLVVIPFAGYFLHRYGQRLQVRRRDTPFAPFNRLERIALWQQELSYHRGFTVLSFIGLLVTTWLANT